MKAVRGKTTVTFDRIIGAGSSYLLGIRLVPISQNEIASVTLPEGTRVQYEEFHSMLGHPGTSSVQRTAEYLGLNLSKPIEKCSDCATAKMRQKNIPKENVNQSSVPGERLCIDTSSVKSKSYGGNKYWSLAVDDATGMTFASFIARKGQVKEHIVPLIHQLRNKGKTVKYIRCDNAGENIKLKEECDRQKLGIEFEFTAPNTPQQNGVVERKFATLMEEEGPCLIKQASIARCGRAYGQKQPVLLHCLIQSPLSLVKQSAHMNYFLELYQTGLNISERLEKLAL